MKSYTFTNKFKSKRFNKRFRPNVNNTFGMPLSFLKIKCKTIKDRINELLEIPRSKKFKYCIDNLDGIKYIYDLDLFRDTGSQYIEENNTLILRDHYKENNKI